jgi:hypothetical protein
MPSQGQRFDHKTFISNREAPGFLEFLSVLRI